MRSLLAASLSSCLLFLAAGARASSDEDVFAPLRAELTRSMRRLKQDSFGPPYFAAFRVVDNLHFDVAAAYGSVLQEGEDDFRVLFSEVRYGSPELDNTELSSRGWHVAAGRDEDSLRQAAWQLTDAAYKSAVAGFLEKKAKRATELVTEKLDDFSKEPVAKKITYQEERNEDRARARRNVERLSAVFKKHPDILESNASSRVRWARRWLITSEGTELATPAENVPSDLRVDATARADDGMRLDNHVSWSVRSLDELPPMGQLEAAVERVARELEDLRKAPVQAPTAAPAIFDPEFTGVLFHEALGHKLEGQRQRDPQQSQVFKDLVGKRIIPEFLSLIDDPTMKEFGGEPLHGHYEFDSEGVPAQRVVLVDHGVLESFLMSRWPVKGFAHSNGHGRADAYLRPTGRMANLIVKAENPVPKKELESRMLDLLRKTGKPYGFMLVGAFGGENPNLREAAQTLEVRPRLIYRVEAATGKTSLVRGVSVVGTPLVVLNRILAAGDDMTLANGFHCGAESGFVPVDQIAPSVLVSEIELQRLPEDRARPPILRPPLQDR